MNTRYVHALQQHGVHVQEVDREDPGGLGVQELPPRQARAARRRADARGTQDLPHGGRHRGDAEFGQLAVDPAVSPERILLREANDHAGDARDCRRAAWLAAIARVVLARGQPAVPGEQRRGRDGEDFGPALAGEEWCQRGEPHPVGRLVLYPASVAAQHCVFVPERKQFSILCQVLRSTEAARPSIRRTSR